VPSGGTVTDTSVFAPGWPGIPARWTSSAKSGIGAANNPRSHVWFTLSHGILNEIYYPEVDQACTRDLGLLVTDGAEFFSEEKRHTSSRVEHLAPGVAAFRVVNTCLQGRYRIEKEILADPYGDAVVQRTRFIALEDLLHPHVYVLLAPHLKNHGLGNTAWVATFAGTPLLFAERDGVVLALACSVPWKRRSVGFVGFSDGWQDVSRHKRMEWEYERAENGNTALTGEVDLSKSKGTFLLAVGFGRTAGEAAQAAMAAVDRDFDAAIEQTHREWQDWQAGLLDLGDTAPGTRNLYRCSTTVLQSSESMSTPGGIIASLSIPWGFAKGDDDLGGYHLVWPRDLVETAGAFLAAGASDNALRVLAYLEATQLPDGHWPQNMWLNGTPYWNGIQMDEAGFPILLVDLAARVQALSPDLEARYWFMVKKAAAFLVVNGPVTQQDRWEEDPGYSPFTLAVEIAALLAAADIAERHAEPGVASFLRETAALWNAQVERWTWSSGSALAHRLGVDGYYVRIAPPDVSDASSPAGGFVCIKNRPPGESLEPAVDIISPDALALVRFGLRSPDDPRIVSTVKAIDALLRVRTPAGDVWHRYDGDGYGEHEDGAPFDGTGVGRAWPLLTGERAHYELAAGRREEAERYKLTLETLAHDSGMLPEQVWDADDLPEHELFFGRATGSAMPLVWAHAEYIKLCRSLRDGAVFDLPPQPWQRYVEQQTPSSLWMWRFNHRIRSMPRGRTLRIEVLSPALIHWSADDWNTTRDVRTRNTGLGIHLVDLDTPALPAGTTICFTMRWEDSGTWEGTDHAIRIEAT